MTNNEPPNDDNFNIVCFESDYEPVIIEVNPIGPVTFGFISLRLVTELPDLEEIESDFNFALEFSHRLIVNPEVSRDEWRSVAKPDLLTVFDTLGTQHKSLTPYYSPINRENIPKAFREAIGCLFEIEVVQPIADLATKLKPQMEQLEQIGAAWSRWLNEQEQIFSKINTAFTKLSTDLEKFFRISLDETNSFLSEFQWFILPDMPPEFIHSIREAYFTNANPQEAIDKLYVDYYCENRNENIKKMVNQWEKNDIFVHRKHIFKDAVTVLEINRPSFNPSNIIIPSLISQVDGILRVFVSQRGASFKRTHCYNEKGEEEPIKNLLLRLIDEVPENFDPPSWLIKNHSPATSFLFDVMFQRAFWGDKGKIPPTALCRHKIMHGEFTRYGNIENTVRCFLILHFLAYLNLEIPREEEPN